MKAKQNILLVALLPLVILPLGCHRSVLKSGADGQVKIHITETRSYCGGARPPQEILDELTSPKPAANMKIFIGKGEVNSGKDYVMELTTDATGKVEFRLPEGDYYLVFQDKLLANYDLLLSNYRTETDVYSAIDKDCLSGWFATPELKMKIDPNGAAQFELNHHIPCSWDAVPCIDYHGPLPP